MRALHSLKHYSPSWQLILVSLIILIFVVSCGTGGTTVETPAEQAEESPAEIEESESEPVAETEPTAEQESTVEEPPAVIEGRDTVIIGALADDYDQEPEVSRFPNYNLHTGTCEPLVRLTPEYEIIPWLAESYEYMGDNIFRFHLRQDVTFHDGTPLTAEAVVWSFDRNVRGGNVGSALLQEGSVTIVDEHTVDITPSAPNLRLPEQILHPTWALYAPGTEPVEEVVCTGPWMVESYTPHEEIVLVRNDNYWGELPQLRQLIFRFFPDDTTRLLALEAGEIDFMMNVPPDEVSRLSQMEEFKVVQAPVGRNILLYLNIHGEEPYTILQEVNVRKAIGMGIDRETLVNVIMDGNAAIAQLMAPASILGEHADTVEGFSYDPEAASALLEEAGWVDSDGDGIREKDGRRLSLKMIGWVEFPQTYYEFIQANMADIGIEIVLSPAPDQASYSEVLNAGEFDIDMEGPNQNDGNPIFLPALRFYSKGSGPNIKFFAPGETFDVIVEEAAGSADLELVREKSAEGMRLLIDEEAIVIPVAGLFRIYAMRAELEGFDAHPSWNNQLYNTLYFSGE